MHPFPDQETLRIQNLRNAVAHAFQGDRDQAELFLTSPHPDLDGLSPLRAARKDELGARNALHLVAQKSMSY